MGTLHRLGTTTTTGRLRWRGTRGTAPSLLAVAALTALALVVALTSPPMGVPSDGELAARVAVCADLCLILAGSAAFSAALLLGLREATGGRAQAISASLACWAVGVMSDALIDLLTTGTTASEDPHLTSALTWPVVAAVLIAAGRWTWADWAPPWLVGAGLGGMVSATGLLLGSIVPAVPGARSVAAGAVLVGAAVAILAVVRTVDLPEPFIRAVAIALALLGAGDTARTLDRGLVGATGGAALALSGGVLMWVAAVRITRAALAVDRRRVADQSRRARRAEESDREARERLHGVSASVAGLAHASRLLALGDELDDRARRRLISLVESELARVDRLAGGTRGGASSCRPDAVLDRLATSLAVQGQHVDRGSCDVEVAVGEDVLFELLHVLLLNGVRHAGGRGLRVRFDMSGSLLAVRVEDDGPGVPHHRRARVFEWGEVGPASPGQGIGLAGAQRLAVEAGGALELTEPQEGRGSAFLLLLPVVRDHGRAPDQVPTSGA